MGIASARSWTLPATVRTRRITRRFTRRVHDVHAVIERGETARGGVGMSFRSFEKLSMSLTIQDGGSRVIVTIALAIRLCEDETLAREFPNLTRRGRHEHHPPRAGRYGRVVFQG